MSTVVIPAPATVTPAPQPPTIELVPPTRKGHRRTSRRLNELSQTFPPLSGVLGTGITPLQSDSNTASKPEPKPVLQGADEGWFQPCSTWKLDIQYPGSNGTPTEMGLFSVSRSGISGIQNLTGNFSDQIWMLYSNENVTQAFQFDCKSPQWISSPYVSGATVRNLMSPFENYTLADSLLLQQ
jgi:hypothetical protein